MKHERWGGAHLACWLPVNWGHGRTFSCIHSYLFPLEVKRAVAVKLSDCAGLWGNQNQYLPPSFLLNVLLLMNWHECTSDGAESRSRVICCSLLCRIIALHNKTLQTNGALYTRHWCRLYCVNNVCVLTVSESRLIDGWKKKHTINIFNSGLISFSGNNIHIWTRRWTDHIHVATKWPS